MEYAVRIRSANGDVEQLSQSEYDSLYSRVISVTAPEKRWISSELRMIFQRNSNYGENKLKQKYRLLVDW